LPTDTVVRSRSRVISQATTRPELNTLMSQLDERSLAPGPESDSVAKQDIECFGRACERALGSSKP
jgi:hypothetical protein